MLYKPGDRTAEFFLALDGVIEIYVSRRTTQQVVHEYHETQKLINRGERPDAAAARASGLISEMTTAFDDALVENCEPRDGDFNLPDPDDQHLMATASVGV